MATQAPTVSRLASRHSSGALDTLIIGCWCSGGREKGGSNDCSAAGEASEKHGGRNGRPERFRSRLVAMGCFSILFQRNARKTN